MHACWDFDVFNEQSSPPDKHQNSVQAALIYHISRAVIILILE